MAKLDPRDAFPQSNDPGSQVSAAVDLAGASLEDVTVKEVIIGESLLNPSAHAAVTLQSAMYFRPTNWNYFRCQPITIRIKDNSGNQARTMIVNQQIFGKSHGSVLHQDQLLMKLYKRSALRDQSFHKAAQDQDVLMWPSLFILYKLFSNKQT